jgi:hypothetical protein
MRSPLIGLAALICALAADANLASAQESFFNDRYCTRGMGFRSGGSLDCSYRTWAQCIESARVPGEPVVAAATFSARPAAAVQVGRFRRAAASPPAGYYLAGAP